MLRFLHLLQQGGGPICRTNPNSLTSRLRVDPADDGVELAIVSGGWGLGPESAPYAWLDTTAYRL